MTKEKNLEMLIDSKMLNIGIFTLISFFIFLISRFFRGIENELYNKLVLIFSILYFLFTLLINNFYIYDFCKIFNNLEIEMKKKFKKWIFAFRLLIFLNLLFICFIILFFCKVYYKF